MRFCARESGASLRTQDATPDAVSESGDGQPGSEDDRYPDMSIRGRTFLAILLWAEAAWAASFLGWTLAYWAGLPASFGRPFFGSQQAIYSLIPTTDMPRFALYVAFIGAVAVLLAASGFAMWRSRSARAEGFAGILAMGALWSQPVLVVLIIESALALKWDSTPDGALLPSFPILAIIGVGLVVGVAALFLGQGLPRSVRMGSLGVTLVIVATAVVPFLLVEGYVGSREVFSTFGVLPTGRSSEVAAIDCPSLTRCVAEGSNILSAQAPLQYEAVAALTGPDSKWRTVPLSPLEVRGSSSQTVVLGGSSTVTSIACPTTRTCLAVGLWSLSPSLKFSLPIWRSEDGGEHWVLTSVPLPRTSGTVNLIARQSIACMNVRSCVASNGQVVIATRDGGTHWEVVTGVAGRRVVNPATVLTCPTRQECIVVSARAESLGTKAGIKLLGQLTTMVTSTSNAGLTWVTHRVGGLVFQPQALACWNSNDCLLSGVPTFTLTSALSLYLTTDRGRHWRRITAAVGPLGFQQIQCARVARVLRHHGQLHHQDHGRRQDLDDGAHGHCAHRRFGLVLRDSPELRCRRNRELVLRTIRGLVDDR